MKVTYFDDTGYTEVTAPDGQWFSVSELGGRKFLITSGSGREVKSNGKLGKSITNAVREFRATRS